MNELHPEFLDASIDATSSRLWQLDPRDPLDAAVWIDYGQMLWDRYNQTRFAERRHPDRADLDALIEAVERASTAYCGLAEPHAEAEVLGLLADALRERHAIGHGSWTDLDDAVRLMARALSLVGRGTPEWFDRAEELAGLHIDRYQVTFALVEFEAARGALCTLLATRGSDAEETRHAWSELGFVHAMRYERGGLEDDRDRAIEAFAAARRHGASGPPLASSYAAMLIDRGTAMRHDDDFRAAIEVVDAALAGPDLPDENRATLDSRALMAHLNRYHLGYGTERDLLAAARHAAAVLDNPAATRRARNVARLIADKSTVSRSRVPARSVGGRRPGRPIIRRPDAPARPRKPR
jgi:hypothetical protein